MKRDWAQRSQLSNKWTRFGTILIKPKHQNTRITLLTRKGKEKKLLNKRKTKNNQTHKKKKKGRGEGEVGRPREQTQSQQNRQGRAAPWETNDWAPPRSSQSHVTEAEREEVNIRKQGQRREREKDQTKIIVFLLLGKENSRNNLLPVEEKKKGGLTEERERPRNRKDSLELEGHCWRAVLISAICFLWFPFSSLDLFLLVVSFPNFFF